MRRHGAHSTTGPARGAVGVIATCVWPPCNSPIAPTASGRNAAGNITWIPDCPRPERHAGTAKATRSGAMYSTLVHRAPTSTASIRPPLARLSSRARILSIMRILAVSAAAGRPAADRADDSAPGTR